MVEDCAVLRQHEFLGEEGMSMSDYWMQTTIDSIVRIGSWEKI